MQYLFAVSTTLSGKYEEILRKLFRRCALLVKLEQLAEKSKANIEFIEANFSTSDKAAEVILDS